MTTISWHTNVISDGGHLDTIRECQMVTTKNICWSQSSFSGTLIENPACVVTFSWWVDCVPHWPG